MKKRRVYACIKGNISRAYLRSMGFSQAKIVATPADVNVSPKKDNGITKAVDPVWHQSMVGSLLYASIATRLDIAQAVGAVLKYNSNPSEAHSTTVKQIMRYLKGAIDIALYYKKAKDGVLVSYSKSS